MRVLNAFLVSCVLLVVSEIQDLSASNCDLRCLVPRPKSSQENGQRWSVVYFSLTRQRCRRFTFYGSPPLGNIFVTMNACEETCGSCITLGGEVSKTRENSTNHLARPPYECGYLAGNRKCSGDKTGWCCSQWGLCGRSAEACGAGCNSKFGGPCVEPKDNQCGVPFFKKCTGEHTGLCCSQSGYCGFTDAYCGTKCQEDWGGNCGAVAAFVATNLLGPTGWPINWDRACGWRYGKYCSGPYEEQCCQKSTGLCGTSTDHCLIKYCDIEYTRKPCASSKSDTVLRFG